MTGTSLWFLMDVGKDVEKLIWFKGQCLLVRTHEIVDKAWRVNEVYACVRCMPTYAHIWTYHICILMTNLKAWKWLTSAEISQGPPYIVAQQFRGTDKQGGQITANLDGCNVLTGNTHYHWASCEAAEQKTTHDLNLVLRQEYCHFSTVMLLSVLAEAIDACGHRCPPIKLFTRRTLNNTSASLQRRVQQHSGHLLHRREIKLFLE